MFVLVLLTPISLSNCRVPDESVEPRRYGLRLSVKNEMSSVLTVKLVAGIIPSENARFEELSLIPDNIYKLRNPNWSAELGTECTLNPGKYDSVYNYLPISGLGVEIENIENYENLSPAVIENFENRKKMLDKLISFTLTINRGGEIVYRAVGWDVPEDDMETYRIDDKMWGIYDTAKENYYDDYDQRHAYPRLTSKLFPSGRESDFISSLTYYIRATPTGIFLQKMDPYSYTEKDYWK